MTPRGKDKWQSLPNVVAQLQAEAANPAISRPRIAWPDEPVRAGAGEARPTVHGHRGHERRPQAPGTAARATTPPLPALRERALARAPASVPPPIPALRERALERAVDRAPGSEPTPAPDRREYAIERPSTSEPANERTPTNEQIDWGGLGDYDRLAADPRPDLRALVLLVGDVCQRSLGARYRSIERLVGDVNRRIDQLLVDPDAASRRAQRQALSKLLDRIEDLLVSLMVNS
jgi:hypothetical protein